MIKVNGEKVKLNKFPDGTFLIKEENFPDIANISWFFESNEELVALYFICRHLRSNGSKIINLLMPYIPNARQDRVKSPKDIHTLKYFSELINSLDFNEVCVIDPHSAVSEGLINNIKIISPKLYVKRALGMIPSGDDVAIFYPDEGAMKRYAGMIQKPYTFGYKDRNWETGEIKGLEVFGDIQNIKDKDILIVDDICSKGGTFYHSAKKLKELGANDIYLYVTHCENTILKGELLTSGLIKKVFTTNSIFTECNDDIEVIEI